MVQETTTTSWGKRIINAFWGVLIGFALVIGAFFLIFWNEGNALHTAQSLEQAGKVVVSVANAPIDTKNDMRVIYFSGLATTDDILSDNVLNVSEKAIQLHRNVEMYQWKEEVETKSEKQVGGSEQEVKTYTYNKVWSSGHIDSSEFKDQTGHENPASLPIKSQTQYANKVTVGDFSLPVDIIKQISGDKSVDLSKANADALKQRFNKPVHLQSEILYLGDDEQAPKIGDLRITEAAVFPATVSVIAQQTGKTVQPYMAPAGHTVSLLEMGQVSPQEMIHNAAVQNRMMAWLLRLVSLIMMIVGLALIMSPLSVLADFLPFLGSLVGFGTGFIAFALGLCLWLIAIAIAWFVVRPLISIVLFIIAAVLCFSVVAYRRRKK